MYCSPSVCQNNKNKLRPVDSPNAIIISGIRPKYLDINPMMNENEAAATPKTTNQ